MKILSTDKTEVLFFCRIQHTKHTTELTTNTNVERYSQRTFGTMCKGLYVTYTGFKAPKKGLHSPNIEGLTSG